MSENHLTPEDVFHLLEASLQPHRLKWVREHALRCEECVHWMAMVLAASRAGYGAHLRIRLDTQEGA